ncbi:hypothetical protein [Calothrix sp. NIES-2098]|uniref:hypothetical protein n=1 Tax=Calothrix sp. NIES-2098 TaxID=1954171 RepID=UPI0030DB7432
MLITRQQEGQYLSGGLLKCDRTINLTDSHLSAHPYRWNARLPAYSAKIYPVRARGERDWTTIIKLI